MRLFDRGGSDGGAAPAPVRQLAAPEVDAGGRGHPAAGGVLDAVVEGALADEAERPAVEGLTPLGANGGRKRADRGKIEIPIGRKVTAWDTAYAAEFLLSEESTYITGQVLAVDGGRLLN